MRVLRGAGGQGDHQPRGEEAGDVVGAGPVAGQPMRGEQRRDLVEAGAVAPDHRLVARVVRGVQVQVVADHVQPALVGQAQRGLERRREDAHVAHAGDHRHLAGGQQRVDRVGKARVDQERRRAGPPHRRTDRERDLRLEREGQPETGPAQQRGPGRGAIGVLPRRLGGSTHEHAVRLGRRQCVTDRGGVRRIRGYRREAHRAAGQRGAYPRDVADAGGGRAVAGEKDHGRAVGRRGGKGEAGGAGERPAADDGEG
jgi:hypothetical protein